MNITRYLNKKFFNHENSSIYNSEHVHDAQLISFEMKDDTMHSTNLKLLVGDFMVYYSFYGDNLLLMIFVEFLNKSSLWDVSIRYNTRFSVPIVKVILNTKEILNQPFFSSALQCFLSKYLSQLGDYDYENITSYLPPSCDGLFLEREILDGSFPLFQYQIRNINYMMEIENLKYINIDLNHHFPVTENESILISPCGEIQRPNCEDEIKFRIQVKGGIFSDEMGLGKTITCLKLIQVKPRRNMKKDMELRKVSSRVSHSYKLKSKSTVIVCPSHLTQQWLRECKKIFNESLKYLLIVSKPTFQKISYYDFMTSDIIIISQQFLMNCQYYPQLRVDLEFANKIKTLHNLNTPCNFQTRLTMIRNNFPLKDDEILFLNNPDYHNNNMDDAMTLKSFQVKEKLQSIMEPNLEHFDFHRLILDEGHEIFGLKLQTTYHAEYLKKFLCCLCTRHRWYVSGTPFVSLAAVNNTLEFLDFSMYKQESKNSNFEKISYKDRTKSYMVDKIMNKIMIRHQKKDVEDQINIPKFEEEIIWVNLSSIERQIYDNFVRTQESDINLQKLCCHIFLTHRNHNSNQEHLDLATVKGELLKYHNEKLEKNLKKMNDLRNRNHNSLSEPTVEMKKLEEKISEAKYMIQVLEKYSALDSIQDENAMEEEEEDECCICLDTFLNPILTKCGHKFCKACITRNLVMNSNCPICKVSLKNIHNKVQFIELGVKQSFETELHEKYGSKLGMLITKLEELVENKDNRIIIFSQWDGMLQIIGKTLAENNISNVFVKGNVFCRNNAISKFKNGIETQVIMLSLDNAASGTNLNNATHVIFVEPINVEKKILNSIERQALGRACRLGQKNEVKVIRIMTKNTIEEKIFRENYS